MAAIAPAPFFALTQVVQPQTKLRAAITAAYRRPEPECLPPLLEQATLPPEAAQQVHDLARDLVLTLRAKGTRGLVENLLQEYALSSQEGVALMCLAEALLRIPDTATRDALIRDKIGGRRLARHLGAQPVAVRQRRDLGAADHRATDGDSQRDRPCRGADPADRARRRAADPRAASNIAMRLMGEQFVLGETIDRGAWPTAVALEAQGFRYSYDMLGEAATDRRGCRALFRRLRAGDPRDRQGGGPGAAFTKVPASRSSCRRCIRATRARSGGG